MIELIRQKYLAKKEVVSEDTVLRIMHESFRGRHTMICGTTGSGKSVLLMQLLQYMKMERGQRCLILDMKGEISDHFGYVKAFIQLKIDHLRNARQTLDGASVDKIVAYWDSKKESTKDITTSEAFVLNVEYERILEDLAVQSFVYFTKRFDTLERKSGRHITWSKEKNDFMEGIPAEIEVLEELLAKDFPDDIFFCPIEDRSVQWNIFNDIHTFQDIEVFSFSAFPELGGKDAFWDDSARAVFQALLLFLKQTKRPTNRDLWDFMNDKDKLMLLVADGDKLKSMVDEFGFSADVFLKAKNYLEGGSSGDRVGSIINTMSVKLRFMELIKDMDGDFSFKQWAKSGEGSLFFSVPEDQKDSLMNLYRIPIELMTKTMLGLPDMTAPSRTTKPLNLTLDEFSGLGKISSAIDALQRGRSKGLNVFIAVQTLKDIVNNFGPEQADIIMDNINTRFFFRTEKSSEDVSKIIGKTVVKAKNHSTSYGKSDMRDGYSISENEVEKDAFSPAEIKSLKDREYVATTIDTDWWTAKVSYIRRPFINKAMNFKQTPVSRNIERVTVDLLIKRLIEVELAEIENKRTAKEEKTAPVNPMPMTEADRAEFERLQAVKREAEGVAIITEERKATTVIKTGVINLDELFKLRELSNETAVSAVDTSKEMSYLDVFSVPAAVAAAAIAVESVVAEKEEVVEDIDLEKLLEIDEEDDIYIDDSSSDEGNPF